MLGGGTTQLTPICFDRLTKADTSYMEWFTPSSLSLYIL